MPTLCQWGEGCACGEQDCRIPLPPNTLAYLDVERLGVSSPHCDCMVVVKCNNSTLVILLVELKNARNFFINQVASYIAERLCCKTATQTRELLDKLKPKFETCTRLSAKVAQTLQAPTHTLIIACAATLPKIDNDLKASIQRRVQDLCGRVPPEYTFTQLLRDAIKNIVDDMKRKINQGCNTAREYDAHHYAGILACNPTTLEIIETVENLCRKGCAQRSRP